MLVESDEEMMSLTKMVELLQEESMMHHKEDRGNRRRINGTSRIYLIYHEKNDCNITKMYFCNR